MFQPLETHLYSGLSQGNKRRAGGRDGWGSCRETLVFHPGDTWWKFTLWIFHVMFGSRWLGVDTVLPFEFSSVSQFCMACELFP